MYNNHTISLQNRDYEKETELSEYVWDLKDKGEDFTIKLSVVAIALPYICGSNCYDLCLTEKMVINKADSRTLLNKRSEIVSKCCHHNKFTLNRFKPPKELLYKLIKANWKKS